MLQLPLQLERVIVDRLSLDDAPVLAAYRSDPDVARWQDWETPFPLADAEAFIADVAQSEVAVPGARTNLAVRVDEQLVGDVYLHVLAEMPHIAEVGVTLRSGSQGQGYASEALSGLISRLFEGGEVIKIMAYVDVDNTPSLDLCRRLGLNQEGRLSHSIRRADGSYADEILFGLVNI